MSFYLTNAAEEDITNIISTGASLFGISQAKAYHASLERVFNLIADNPKLAGGIPILHSCGLKKRFDRLLPSPALQCYA